MKNFTQVPNWITEDPIITGSALKLLVYLLRRHTQPGWTYRRQDILDHTGMCVNTYQKARNQLLELNILIDKTPESKNISFFINKYALEHKTYADEPKEKKDGQWITLSRLDFHKFSSNLRPDGKYESPKDGKVYELCKPDKIREVVIGTKK